LRLKCLHEVGKWRILALEDEAGCCEFEESLAALHDDLSTAATARGFVAVLGRIPSGGPRQLPKPLYHRIDADNEIYQFTKANHRLVCFEADGAMVICSHIFRKTSQRTPDSEIQKAIRLRQQYLAFKAAQNRHAGRRE
jgi:hypothetical protein